MTFELSDEQQMLKDSVDKFVAQDYVFETRRALANSDLGYSKKNWETFADLGWLTVPFREESGGFGGNLRDVATITEALGKGLVTEPYLQNLILGGRLIEMLGNEKQKARILTATINGETQLALAHTERRAGGNPACVSCTAKVDGDDFLLSGEKVMALNGPNADLLLVTARSSGGERDRQGIEVFLVDPVSEGVNTRDYPTIDNLRASDITLDKVRVPTAARMGHGDTNIDALETLLDEAIVASCAEAIGIMDVLVRDTVDYARTRKQFGMPLGKFQVLQHRMVDMYIAHEQSTSMLLMATERVPQGGDNARQAASALKVYVGKSAKFIGEQAIQIHGGMGTTDELNIGHYFKRLLAIEALFGDIDYHINRYASLIKEAA